MSCAYKNFFKMRNNLLDVLQAMDDTRYKVIPTPQREVGNSENEVVLWLARGMISSHPRTDT